MLKWPYKYRHYRNNVNYYINIVTKKYMLDNLGSNFIINDIKRVKGIQFSHDVCLG